MCSPERTCRRSRFCDSKTGGGPDSGKEEAQRLARQGTEATGVAAALGDGA